MAVKLIFSMFLTMFLLFGFLFAVLAGAGIYFSLSTTAIVAFAVILVAAQWWIGPAVVRWSVNMSPLPQEYKWIREFVHDHCRKTKTPEPKNIFIGNVGEPNAFVWGRTSGSANMCITRGLLGMLTKDEVKAVIGHEIGHIKNRDMVVMTVAGAVPTILYMIAISILWGPRDRNSGAAFAVGMGAYLVYFITNLLVLYLSRTREYFADHFSARTHKQPKHLASALTKITYGMGAYSSHKQKKHDGARLFGIADPIAAVGEMRSLKGVYDDLHVSEEEINQAMEWEKKNPLVRFTEIFRTHPLTFKRVAVLQKLAKES